MRQWFTTFFEKIDSHFANLTRHCPKCGGQLDRQFSLLDKIGLFLPMPHTIYAYHCCEQCGTRFRSYRNLTDLFLEASWISCCAYLGEFRLLALVCPLTWLISARWVGKAGWGSGADTVAAAVLTGILWFIAIVFGGGMKHASILSHSVVSFLLLLALVLLPVWLVLLLDKYTTFGLQEYP